MLPASEQKGIRGNGEQAERENTLDVLTSAIGALQGACNRLAGSVRGVNTDLEAANLRLADALKVHEETAAYLEDVLLGIPSGVVVVDLEGRIVLFNRTAEIITGFRASELSGRRYSETIGQNVPQRQTPLFTLATGFCLEQVEKAIIARSGEEIPVSSSTSLIGGRTSMAGAVEVIADLRKLKALEAEVDRVRTLAATGELAAVVAHEIRNPLGGIKGFASLLERELESAPESLALLRRIKEGIESLEGIVNDLLEAGSDNRLMFEDSDMVSEIRKVIDVCRMAAEGEGKRIEFEVSTPNTPVYCRVDAGRMRQALTNLVRNAVEAVGTSGRVAVTLRTRNGAGPTATGLRDSGDHLYIQVTDTGPGIEVNDAGKIFTPFFTTKHGGTGLGLPTVQRIAAMHGGEVEYSRPEAGGSMFTITIPRW
jgi:PAS domain S-box-containing protein